VARMDRKDIAIIGGGPAGLMGAEVLATAGHVVTVYEAMPTVGRKFLLAGKSGLNITHAEDYHGFRTRFGAASGHLRPALDAFTPEDVRAWVAGLGTETFVGSSNRVFPTSMKASPLMRSWLRRLDGLGVKVLTRHRWAGFEGGGYRIESPDGVSIIKPDAVLLALGGASWPRLGSDAAWVGWLAERGVAIAPLLPANCGFDVDWSGVMRDGFAGAPVKSVTATSANGTFPGEFVVTADGIEGSLVYAHASALRDTLAAEGRAGLVVDLVPGRTPERLEQDLARQDRKASFTNRLRKGAGIEGVKLALLREFTPQTEFTDAAKLAHRIKALAIPVMRPRPIAEAISSAGGIRFGDLDENYMLGALPGIFAAGEMLDWEAPTGGYLLTACFATGRAAAKGILSWLERRDMQQR
jgi:uncharacterized flavoprotein (TIGR03862 family)